MIIEWGNSLKRRLQQMYKDVAWKVFSKPIIIPPVEPIIHNVATISLLLANSDSASIFSGSVANLAIASNHSLGVSIKSNDIIGVTIKSTDSATLRV